MNKPIRSLVMLLIIVLTGMISWNQNMLRAKAERIKIFWYVSLGPGCSVEQSKVEEQVIETFNKQQDEIELKMNLCTSGQIR
jgi:hypothetical protein